MVKISEIDESTFVMPDAWRGARHPRRDRPDVPQPAAPDEAAAEQARSLVDDARDRIEEVLALPGTVPELADAARAHLRGAPTPLGAATVAFVASFPARPMDHRGVPFVFPDAWVTDHGIAFAAAAFADFAGIWADGQTVRDLAPGESFREVFQWSGVRHRDAREHRSGWWLTREAVKWLRTLLAAAPDDVHSAAVELLELRRGHQLQRLITAYLAPTRDDWADELCANTEPSATEPFQRWMAFCALGRPHQPAELGLRLSAAQGIDVIASLIDGLGPGATVPLLADAVDRASVGYDAPAPQDILLTFPLDEAFQALNERGGDLDTGPALVAAARRYPGRAMRLLPLSKAPRAAVLLPAHVRAHPALAEKVLPTLPAEAREGVREILDDMTRFPRAADLPPLLIEPPWTRAKPEPVVIKGLPMPGLRAAVWERGERETWAAEADNKPDHLIEEWAGEFDNISSFHQAAVLMNGPDELVRPLLAGWKPGAVWRVDKFILAIVARFEADAAECALFIARRDRASAGAALMPLLTDEIVRTMADWLVHRKKLDETARAWFARHGLAAAPALIPDALGKAGKARRAAEGALRLLAERHGRAPIAEAARVHGEESADAIEAMLPDGLLDSVPSMVPAVDWVKPHMLPQILLGDRAEILPNDAVGHVLTMLAMSKSRDVYAGVRVVRELCDPASLAEFGWALFRWWEICGADPTEKWAFTQLALTGDDETVRRLTPLIRAWPGDGGHAKAVAGLDVLAAIGTDSALIHLYSISQRVKFKGLKARAQEKIEEVAAGLELTAEQLADRLVPDLGLNASGTMVLDYGPRRFVIGFDESLRPTVADEDGSPRKALPKPGKSDDPELAPAAYKRFSDLKKDVRTAAADQLTRFRTAMVTGRRWQGGEFRGFLVAHPLVGHLVRRLVWVAETREGATDAYRVEAFRVAEDGTYANADDDTVPLPETERIGVAHPVDLGDALPAWAGLFADYEILQPFPQLEHPVHTLTEDERDAGRLTRFESLEVPAGALLGLVRRGWERGGPMDAGIEHWISRRVADDRHLVITLDPGMNTGMPVESGDQTLVDVRLAEHPYFHRRDEPTSLRFGDLAPIVASELLDDLIHLAASAE
ncbi:DUF4132 domain-containing protein [Spirillospora sp. NBC_01491]|uniref:DUF4132 domain-containing protein n=1 Tax=Spirillospora sp. NBC_01491 TaxID=2976007 RepID=UPI002E37CBD3|nr:DUF4132 domain-containing protein [Spirillospora sp. NBC_01491]